MLTKLNQFGAASWMLRAPDVWLDSPTRLRQFFYVQDVNSYVNEDDAAHSAQQKEA